MSAALPVLAFSVAPSMVAMARERLISYPYA